MTEKNTNPGGYEGERIIMKRIVPTIGKIYTNRGGGKMVIFIKK